VVNVLTLYFSYAFTKISVLMLYLRVIGQSSRSLRFAVYFMIFAVCGIVLGCTIDLLTFCSPVQKLFNPLLPGSCANFNANLFFAQAILSAITDVFLLVPPIPIIWRLPSSRGRKIGLILILCLGFM
jgi:hypothetical protein